MRIGSMRGGGALGWLPIALVLCTLLAAGAAPAFTLTPFAGDPSEVTVHLSDTHQGAIEMDVRVTSGFGDIRGIFFNVSDPSLLSGLHVTGPDVTDVTFGNVIDLGHGSNLRGGGSPCPCDVGVEIGLPGLRGGSDDHETIRLLVSHNLLHLDPSLFSGQHFGVRLTSVGSDWWKRDGSSKCGGVVPEPSTGLLAGFGLALLAGRRRRRG